MPICPKPWQSNPDLEAALRSTPSLTKETEYLSDFKLYATSMPMSVPITSLGRYSAHDEELNQRESSYAKKTGALLENMRVHSGNGLDNDTQSPSSSGEDYEEDFNDDDAMHRRALQREKILELGLPSYSSSGFPSKESSVTSREERSNSDSSNYLGSFDFY
jgi:hypothetical protein